MIGKRSHLEAAGSGFPIASLRTLALLLLPR
jgi:hypothetical protein